MYYLSKHDSAIIILKKNVARNIARNIAVTYKGNGITFTACMCYVPSFKQSITACFANATFIENLKTL